MNLKSLSSMADILSHTPLRTSALHSATFALLYAFFSPPSANVSFGTPSTSILHFAPSTGIGKLIARALAERPDLSARPRIVLDHVQTIRACLRENVGATILPEVDLHGLSAICEALPVRRDLVLVIRAGAPLDAHAAQLADLLTG